MFSFPKAIKIMKKLMTAFKKKSIRFDNERNKKNVVMEPRKEEKIILFLETTLLKILFVP